MNMEPFDNPFDRRPYRAPSPGPIGETMDGTPWTYEPSGDVDGDLVGIDHLVMEGDEEIGCFRDEATARLVSAAREMRAACLATIRAMEFRLAAYGGKNNGYESDCLALARAAIAKVGP